MIGNNLGEKLLVEDCQKVAVSDLLRDYRKQLKEAYLRAQFEILNENVLIMTSKTGRGGLRFWFMCPQCKRRVGVLLRHPAQNVLGCRECLGLAYRGKRYRGMIESKV